MYNDPNCKPWQSNRWAPPGFSNRAEMIQARTDQNNEKSPIGVEEGREEKASYSHDSHAEHASPEIAHPEKQDTLPPV